MKVKLRVPSFAGHVRETSSPLANPIRNAPDYSDEDEAEGVTGANGDQEEMMEDDAEEEEEEADELDEMDELEDEPEATTALATTSSSTPKRKSITLKARSSRGNGAAGTDTISPSPSTSMGDGSMSPTSAEAQARLQASRKAGIAPRSSAAKSMTVEELDALPAAKRRKSAKARGAAGPGRGWRKGLTKGQKPVYELPPHERTPASFGNTSASVIAASPSDAKALAKEPQTQRASPAVGKDRGAAPSRQAGGSAGSSSVKIMSGPGGQPFVGDLSAKAGTAKNPGFRYPPLASSRGGPAVQPLARIPTAFQAAISLEKNQREPRRWIKAAREVLSMGGRPWYVSVYYGGEDRGYDKNAESAASAVPLSGGAKIGGAATPAPPSAEGAATPTRKASSGATDAHPLATSYQGAGAARHQAAQHTASSPTEPLSRSNSASSLAAKGNSAILPPPKHFSGLRETEANWRGQSPAYLFGSR